MADYAYSITRIAGPKSQLDAFRAQGGGDFGIHTVEVGAQPASLNAMMEAAIPTAHRIVSSRPFAQQDHINLYTYSRDVQPLSDIRLASLDHPQLTFTVLTSREQTQELELRVVRGGHVVAEEEHDKHMNDDAVRNHLSSYQLAIEKAQHGEDADEFVHTLVDGKLSNETLAAYQDAVQEKIEYLGGASAKLHPDDVYRATEGLHEGLIENLNIPPTSPFAKMLFARTQQYISASLNEPDRRADLTKEFMADLSNANTQNNFLPPEMEAAEKDGQVQTPPRSMDYHVSEEVMSLYPATRGERIADPIPERVFAREQFDAGITERIRHAFKHASLSHSDWTYVTVPELGPMSIGARRTDLSGSDIEYVMRDNLVNQTQDTSIDKDLGSVVSHTVQALKWKQGTYLSLMAEKAREDEPGVVAEVAGRVVGSISSAIRHTPLMATVIEPMMERVSPGSAPKEDASKVMDAVSGVVGNAFRAGPVYQASGVVEKLVRGDAAPEGHSTAWDGVMRNVDHLFHHTPVYGAVATVEEAFKSEPPHQTAPVVSPHRFLQGFNRPLSGEATTEQGSYIILHSTAVPHQQHLPFGCSEACTVHYMPRISPEEMARLRDAKVPVGISSQAIAVNGATLLAASSYTARQGITTGTTAALAAWAHANGYAERVAFSDDLGEGLRRSARAMESVPGAENLVSGENAAAYCTAAAMRFGGDPEAYAQFLTRCAVEAPHSGPDAGLDKLDDMLSRRSPCTLTKNHSIPEELDAFVKHVASLDRDETKTLFSIDRDRVSQTMDALMMFDAQHNRPMAARPNGAPDYAPIFVQRVAEAEHAIHEWMQDRIVASEAWLHEEPPRARRREIEHVLQLELGRRIEMDKRAGLLPAGFNTSTFLSDTSFVSEMADNASRDVARLQVADKALMGINPDASQTAKRNQPMPLFIDCNAGLDMSRTAAIRVERSPMFAYCHSQRGNLDMVHDLLISARGIGMESALMKAIPSLARNGQYHIGLGEQVQQQESRGVRR